MFLLFTLLSYEIKNVFYSIDYIMFLLYTSFKIIVNFFGGNDGKSM